MWTMKGETNEQQTSLFPVSNLHTFDPIIKLSSISVELSSVRQLTLFIASGLASKSPVAFNHYKVILKTAAQAARIITTAKNLRNSSDIQIRQGVYISANLTKAEANVYQVRSERRQAAERRKQDQQQQQHVTSQSTVSSGHSGAQILLQHPQPSPPPILVNNNIKCIEDRSWWLDPTVGFYRSSSWVMLWSSLPRSIIHLLNIVPSFGYRFSLNSQHRRHSWTSTSVSIRQRPPVSCTLL